MRALLLIALCLGVGTLVNYSEHNRNSPFVSDRPWYRDPYYWVGAGLILGLLTLGSVTEWVAESHGVSIVGLATHQVRH